MTILVTGSTGTVGSQVMRQLTTRGASVRALVREEAKATGFEGVEVVKGALTDVDSVRPPWKGNQ